MEGKLYRFHRATGTVHYIPGCCRFGDVSNPNVHADNFDECYTYEEAENILEQILNQYDRGQRVIKIK